MSIGAPEDFLDIFRGQEVVAEESLMERGLLALAENSHLTMKDGDPVIDGRVLYIIDLPSGGSIINFAEI